MGDAEGGGVLIKEYRAWLVGLKLAAGRRYPRLTNVFDSGFKATL